MASARLHNGPAPFAPDGGPAFLDLSAHVEHHIAYHDFRLSELRAAGGPAAGFAPLPSYLDAGADAFSPLAAWEGFAPTYHAPFELGPFGPAGSGRLPAMTVQRGSQGGCKGSAAAAEQNGLCAVAGGTPAAKGKPRRRVATVAQRRAANIRERRRMFNLNSAFDKLRKKVSALTWL
ncbi:unnamed protein product, partial [Ixodes pacificus]